MWVLLASVPLVACAASGEEQRPADGELVAAAGAGRQDVVERLLRDGADVNGKDGSGRTAVTAAAANEHVGVVKALIDAGADVDLQDDDRSNPLLLCGENGNVALLDEVLKANPDLSATNRYGGVALIPASDRGHVAMVEALLQTDIDVDHVNRLGWTALLEAVILGDGDAAHQRIVELLLDAGADRSIGDKDGVTPLEHAKQSGYDEMVALLEAT